MKSLTFLRLAPLFALALSACGGDGGSPRIREPEAEKAERLCERPRPGTYGVAPLKNKTKSEMELAGTDDLIMTAMSESGCFTLVERDRLTLLVDEMKLCSPDNPDAEYMDCGSFAKKGRIMGLTEMVFGDLIFAEDKVEGRELAAKIPGLGGIELGRTYAALAIELRIVEVETGKVVGTTVVHAVVPSDKAGLSVSQSGAELRAAYGSRTPMGEALHAMISEAVGRLSGARGPASE